MTQNTQKGSCVIGSVGLAVIAGIFATVVALILGGLSWPGAIFLGILAAAVLAVLFLIIFCKPLPALGDVDVTEKAAAASSSAPAAAAVVATAPAAKAAPAPKAKPAAKKPTAKAEAAPKVAKAATAKAPAAKKSTVAKKTAAKPAAASTADGAVSDAFKPATLKKARAGGADDLKLIKGVGPKMEGVCNRLGFFHFDQVAAWSKDELTWVDANLEGFKGRATRDEWVPQAKILAAGGETEFSAKKKK